MKVKNKILLIIFTLACSAVYAQDSLVIKYNYINSAPQDAMVYFNDEFRGNTPLFFTWQDSVFPKVMKITKRGYSDYIENIQEITGINKTVNMVSNSGNNILNSVKEDKASYFKRPRKILPIVVSGLATFGAGASAFYFKTLAIDNRNAGEETGDLQALDRQKKYDLISGISLVVFQAGLGALLYFLLID